MSKYLVYLDQSIISHHVNGVIKITPQPDFDWIYSTIHFDEIRRSHDSEPYLQALEEIDAKYLGLDLDNEYRITGSASLCPAGTPAEHYDKYLESCEEVPIDGSLFNPLLVRVNGGDDKGELQKYPDNLISQVKLVLESLPLSDAGLDVTTFINEAECLLKESVNILQQLDNDILKTREVLGNVKGRFSDIRGDNQILQMWDIISEQYPSLTCDQFFGFEPPDKRNYDSWPMYLGIIGCCAVMDVIGFKSEQKCRKIDEIPNIMSDAGHIAMGAFCTAIMSSDARLLNRASAIYEYKSIGTKALYMTTRKEKG